MASDLKASIASEIVPIFPFKTFVYEEIYFPLAFEGFILKFVNINFLLLLLLNLAYNVGSKVNLNNF